MVRDEYAKGVARVDYVGEYAHVVGAGVEVDVHKGSKEPSTARGKNETIFESKTCIVVRCRLCHGIDNDP